MVRIITDSSTLFTEAEAKEMGIDVLPLCVTIGDLEGRDLQIDMQDFYKRIAESGTMQQKRVATYYNQAIEDREIQQKFANKIIESPEYTISFPTPTLFTPNI